MEGKLFIRDYLSYLQEGDCTCQAGLTCKLTKQIEKMGEVIPIKQCVEEGMDIDIETVDMEDEPDDEDDDELENSPRNKRWFTNWFKVKKIY